MWTIHVISKHMKISLTSKVYYFMVYQSMLNFSVIFTINPIKQLRLLKSELSLEVSEMTDQPPSTNPNQGREEYSANQNRSIPDKSAGENES